MKIDKINGEIGMTLQPDDFKVGMYITVLENLPYQREVEVFEGFTAQMQTVTRNDNSYKGNVLQILAINLPYLTRRTKFISINREYVDSMEVKS